MQLVPGRLSGTTDFCILVGYRVTMGTRRDLWLLLPAPVRRLPADLAAVLILSGLTVGSVFIPVVEETPIRVLFGLVFVLFLPGYAFIAALFPEAGMGPPAADPSDNESTAVDHNDTDAKPNEQVSVLSAPIDRGIDSIERVALSFGLSIAIVPLVGLVLNFTPFGIRLVPIVISITGLTVLLTVIAAVRRWELPPEDRFNVPYRRWIDAGRAELFEPGSNTDAVLNILLALSVLLAVSSVAYAVTVPPQGEQFTEFYILTEDDGGDLIADDYPETLVVGDPYPLHVGIGNNEHEPTTYTVIVQLQRVKIEMTTPTDESAETLEENNENATTEQSVQVLERAELDRYTDVLQHNTTSVEQRELTPTGELTGEELRLTFLLYKGDPPTDPTHDTAYRELHLWVDVTVSDEVLT